MVAISYVAYSSEEYDICDGNQLTVLRVLECADSWVTGKLSRSLPHAGGN